MKISPVILSEVNASRSEAFTQSKDPSQAGARPHPRREFSLRSVLVLLPALAFVLLLASLSSAQTLTGTVKNATTGKPAAGDEVILLKLGQGMEEAGRTKADAKGQFSFKLDDAQSPHLLRAIHQDVTYHRMAPPGTTSVELEVYDVAKKVDGIKVIADIVRAQVEQGQLEIVREFGVQNSSKPPRTQMNERNLEFYIPDGAQIVPDFSTATTENGNPLKSAPVPEGEKNRYSFVFPLRPLPTLPPDSSSSITRTSPTPSCRLLPTPLPARTWPSKFPAKACSRLHSRAARARPAAVRSRTPAPAADLARPSTLPTLCRNINGGF